MYNVHLPLEYYYTVFDNTRKKFSFFFCWGVRANAYTQSPLYYTSAFASQIQFWQCARFSHFPCSKIFAAMFWCCCCWARLSYSEKKRKMFFFYIDWDTRYLLVFIVGTFFSFFWQNLINNTVGYRVNGLFCRCK